MLADLAESRGASLLAPWQDVSDARAALASLAVAAVGLPDPAGSSDLSGAVDGRRLVDWLKKHELAPLGFARALTTDPELATMLKQAAAGAAAGNLAHFAALERIERRFETERIPMTLLKGAAVAGYAYRDPSFRPMSDLDIWVRDDDMPRAIEALRALSFRPDPGLPDRPAALQKMSSGELVFRHARREHGLVELHYGPFPGWWIKRTAQPEMEAIWRRARPMGPGRHACRLAAEDAILQTAFHVAVNQFGQAPLRGLMDLAVLARAHRIDWDAVVARATAWRLKTAAWLVLDIANRLIGLPGCDAAVSRLRPWRTRRAMLQALITPRAVLGGRDLTRTTTRHLFMLALVDRSRDGAKLVGRTLWPESWWIAARYGRPVGRVEHLWGLVRRGAV